MKRLGMALVLTLVAVLALSAFAYAQAGALVSVDPAAQSVESGQQAAVAIMIADVNDLYGAEVHLAFDPTVLEVTGLTPGAFLDETSGSVVSGFDNAAGTVDYAITLLSPAPAVDGAGVLVEVAFRGKTAGTSIVTITDAILADVQGAQITATLSDGTIEVTSVPGGSDIPEASTLALLGSGLVGLAAWARRKLGK